MAKIYSFGNGKGGCGKSTSSTNFAASLAMRGNRVLLIDGDDLQGTASDFISLNNLEFPNNEDQTKLLDAVKLREVDIRRAVSKYDSEYDYIVIDTQPHIDKGLADIVAVTDVFVFTMLCSDADVWACRRIMQVLNDNDDISKRILLCSDITSSTLYDETCELIQLAFDQYDIKPIKILNNRTSTRVSYRRALGAGVPVTFYGDDKATTEIELITSELLEA